jgi:hypothetical protein
MQRWGQCLSLNDTTGINILGSLVEPSQESPHPEFYGALHNYGHVLLGQITDPKGKFDVSMTSFPQTLVGRALCPVAGFSSSGVEPSGSAARELVN